LIDFLQIFVEFSGLCTLLLLVQPDVLGNEFGLLLGLPRARQALVMVFLCPISISARGSHLKISSGAYFWIGHSHLIGQSSLRQ
jgi:hypothetical protein